MAGKQPTIQNFIASMNRSGGFARTSRYAVVISPPAKLLSEDSNRFLVNTQRQVNLHCSTVSMPGHDLQAMEQQHGSAPGREIVRSHDYAGTIAATFYLDSHLRERHFFEQWQRSAVNTQTHKANYYDDYIGTMEIYQLDGDGEITYGIKATEVYPSTIAGIEYAYANTNQIAIQAVQFQYRQWYNLTSDEIAGYSSRVLFKQQDIAGRRDNAEFDSNARFKTNAPLASKNSERKRLEQLRSPEIDRQDRARDSRKRQAKRREQLRSPEVDKQLPNTSFQQEIKRQQQLRPPQVDRKFGGL